jgi:bifunctional DNA-binding transcriptional regulator/antitoxin component of YhaV-PrlF toxin-antitoxin module
MTFKGEATVMEEGEISVPAEILVKLNLKVGDRLLFRMKDSGELTIKVRRRRRICFDNTDHLKLPLIGRPVTRAGVHAPIAAGVNARRRVPRRKMRSR